MHKNSKKEINKARDVAAGGCKWKLIQHEVLYVSPTQTLSANPSVLLPVDNSTCSFQEDFPKSILLCVQLKCLLHQQ